jgi:hypothetical protein
MSDMIEPPPPRLNPRIIKGIFLLLGIGILMPWNAFISATEYFESRLCDSDNASEDKNNQNFESVFAMVFNLSSVISLGLIISIQGFRDQKMAVANNNESSVCEEVPISENNPEQNDYGPDTSLSNSAIIADASDEENNNKKHDHSFWFVMVPLSIYVLVFLGQAVMVLLLDLHAGQFKMLTNVSLVFCGTCAAVAQAGIVATAGLFPSELAMAPYLEVRE